jgi:hypothetical protein
MKMLRIFVLFLAVLIFFRIGALLAHEWYPYACCGGNDCRELRDDEVQSLATGFLVNGTFFVPRKKAQISIDEHFHACFPSGKLGCFFAPLSLTRLGGKSLT